MTKYRFNTLAVHGGQAPDPSEFSCALPIHRTSAFAYKNAAHAKALFDLKEPGNIYTRLGNPTQSVLEERVSLLEGGAAAVAAASGMAAIFNTVVTICSHGDEIVSTSNLYGGTYTLFDAILPQFGISTKLVPINDEAALEAAITPSTRMIYTETIGNPGLDVADLEMYGRVAKKHHLPLVVDSTFTTPALLKPFEYGANIVIHSLSKWMGGHGTGIGGIAVDGGNFDWNDERFELFSKPDPNYHGLVWAKEFAGAPVFALRLRTVPLRNIGACISPDNSWMFLQGLETLHLRMERHCENSLKVAEYLTAHPKVEWVRYPGLGTDQSHMLAKKYLNKGFGGMVVFGIKGGRASGETFMDSLKLFLQLANVGDAKSLALHPGSTTHSQLSDEQQRLAGVAPEMIRLSIGIEDIDDILEDLEQALKKA